MEIMDNNRDSKNEIKRGMQLAATLPDIMPDQADEKIRPVYEDIQRTLRVPIVNLIFRTLANYPDYLVSLWEQLSPTLNTRAFEQAADSLRREALLKPVPKMPKKDLENTDDVDKLRAFNDTIHYVLPKLLLVTTAFELSTFGLDANSGGNDAGSDTSATVPQGVAEGTTKVQMVDPDKASDLVQGLFKAIKERHGHPLVSSYFRGLGNWPAFLEQTWQQLQPFVGTQEYEERKHQLVAQAESLTQKLDFPKLKQAMLNADESAEARAILAAFRHKFIPEMLLDAVLIKAMLDGAEEATSSRFSVT